MPEIKNIKIAEGTAYERDISDVSLTVNGCDGEELYVRLKTRNTKFLVSTAQSIALELGIEIDVNFLTRKGGGAG